MYNKINFPLQKPTFSFFSTERCAENSVFNYLFKYEVTTFGGSLHRGWWRLPNEKVDVVNGDRIFL